MKMSSKKQKSKRVAGRAVSIVVMLVLTLCAVSGFRSLADSFHLPSSARSEETSGGSSGEATPSEAAIQGATLSETDYTGYPSVYSTGAPGRWKKTETGWTFLDMTGNLITGEWIVDSGKYYYVNSFGLMEYGEFRKIGSSWYHLEDTGVMDADRFMVGEDEYMADPNGSLYMNTWVQDGDAWYFCADMGLIVKNGKTPDGYEVDADGKLILPDGTDFEGFLYSNSGNHELYLNLGTADIIWKELQSKGWTGTAIAGLLGNFQQESGVSPTTEQGNHIGYGLGQWSYERRTALESYAASRGKSAGDIYVQLDFLCCESGEKTFVSSFSKTNWESPAAAAIEWGTKWERYNDSEDSSMGTVRIPYAEAYYAHYLFGVKYLVSNTVYNEPVRETASASDASSGISAEENAGEAAAAAADGSESGKITAVNTVKTVQYLSKNGNMITKVIRDVSGTATASDAK